MIERAATGEYPNSDIIVTLISIFFSFILGSFINNWYSEQIQLKSKRFDARTKIIESINQYALTLTSSNLKDDERKQLLTELKIYQNLTIVYFKKNTTESLAKYIADPSVENYGNLMEILKSSQ